MHEPERLAGCDDGLVHVCRRLGRHKELVPQLADLRAEYTNLRAGYEGGRIQSVRPTTANTVNTAELNTCPLERWLRDMSPSSASRPADVGDACGEHERTADVDAPRCAEGERRVRHVRRREGGEQLARAWPLQVDLREPARDVADGRGGCDAAGGGVVLDAPAQQRLDVPVGGVGGDHEEALPVVAAAAIGARARRQLVTVRSASSVPRGESICVYVMAPAGPTC